MISKYVLIRDLAILFIACNMLFWIFPVQPIIWRALLLVLSISAIIGNRKWLPCEKIVLFFCVFNLFYFFIDLLGHIPSTNLIGNVLCGFLSLTLFSYLSEKGVMTEKAFTFIGIILVIVSILSYNYYNNYIHSQMEREVVTTNSYSEFFLMLLPMFFFIKKMTIKWALLLVCVFYLIIGAKRGNIVAASVPLILLVYHAFKGSKRSSLKVVLTLIIIVGASFLVYYWASSNEYLLYRLEQTREGDSSGRDMIYSRAWSLWFGTGNVLNMLFGGGYDGMSRQLGVAAHSDWFEILIDYGLVGVIIYLMIYIRFFRQIRITKDLELKIVIISAVSILFVKGIFSMSFNTSTLPLLMIGLGTALGQYKSSQAT